MNKNQMTYTFSKNILRNSFGLMLDDIFHPEVDFEFGKKRTSLRPVAQSIVYNGKKVSEKYPFDWGHKEEKNFIEEKN